MATIPKPPRRRALTAKPVGVATPAMIDKRNFGRGIIPPPSGLPEGSAGLVLSGPTPAGLAAGAAVEARQLAARLAARAAARNAGGTGREKTDVAKPVKPARGIIPRPIPVERGYKNQRLSPFTRKQGIRRTKSG